jgi:hypothetical protein
LQCVQYCNHYTAPDQVHNDALDGLDIALCSAVLQWHLIQQ